MFCDINLRSFISPCITDLDQDGSLDLIIGKSDGNLYHFEQDEVGSVNFNLVTETFNDINVGSWANPCLL